MNLGNEDKIPELKVDPRTLEWVSCDGEAQMFDSAVIFKRLPALLSPNGEEQHLPMEIAVCRKCGKTPEFIFSRVPDFPENLKSTCNAKKSSGLEL
jgi:hypothetical protein